MLSLVFASVAAAQTPTLTVLGGYTGTGTNLPRSYLATGQSADYGGDTVVGILTSPNNTYVWQGTSAQDTAGTFTNVIKPQGYASNTFNAVNANGTIAGGRCDAPSTFRSFTTSPAPPAAGRSSAATWATTLTTPSRALTAPATSW